MEQNPAAVITLLQAADEIMRSSEQVGGYLVRRAIATDIGALSSVSVVDACVCEMKLYICVMCIK